MNIEPLKLDKIKTNEDIKSLSYARFPGTHCPLFGVCMIASFIEDMAVLVIGTGECTYYAKGFANNISRDKDNFFSMVVSKKELTFGMEKELIEAVKYLVDEHNYKTIMIVTTCVLEVIGEDVDGILKLIEDEISCEVMVVNTEHFKCDSHIIGMERTFTQFVKIMNKSEVKEKTVNILGHRKHGIEKTEIMKSLIAEGVTVNAVIPSKGSIQQIKSASNAALNIVTDFTALPMAKMMEQKFGTPFVYMGRHLFIDVIQREYQKIEDVLKINLSKHLDELKEELLLLETKVSQKIAEKTFIYGNTPMMAFDICHYLCSMGMVPIIIQTREYYEEERKDMDKIIAMGHNPYIVRIANIAPLQKYYDELKPNFYIGHENPMALMKKGIIQLTLDEVTEKIGYEVPICVLKKIEMTFDMFENKDYAVISTKMPPMAMMLQRNVVLEKSSQLLAALTKGE